MRCCVRSRPAFNPPSTEMYQLLHDDAQELTTLRMIGLTSAVGGIQIIWATLMGKTSVSGP